MSLYKSGVSVKAAFKKYLDGKELKAYELDKILEEKGITGFGNKPKIEKKKALDLTILKKPVLNQLARQNEISGAASTRKVDLIKVLVKNDVAPINKDKQTTVSDFNGYKRIRIEIDPQISYNLRTLHKKMVEYTQKAYDEKEFPQFIVLYIKNIETGRIRYYSIRPKDYYFSYDDFKKWYDEIQDEGSSTGSDPTVNFDDNFLIYNKFDIITKEMADLGEGKMINDIYKIKGIDGGKKGLCGYKCIKEIYPELELSEEKYLKDEMKQIDNLRKYISDNKLQINIIGNTLAYKRENKISPERFITHKKEKYMKLNDDEIKYPILYDCEKEVKGYILFDKFEKHYDIIIDEPKLNKIYMDPSGIFYKKTEKGYKSLGKISDIEKINIEYSLEKKKQIEEKYLFFDYETVTDWSDENINKPYMMIFCEFDKDSLKILNDFDEKNDKKSISEMIKNNVIINYGFDCTKKFYEYITKQKNCVYKLISFNGSSFDNLILYNDLLKLQTDQVKSPFFIGNELLNFKIAGVHDLFDLNKYLKTSLQKACESFGINACKKKKVNHDEIQDIYDKDKETFFEDINKKEISEYGAYDVLSLSLLFYKFKKSVSKIEGFKIYANDLCSYKTAGGFVNTIMKDYWKKENYEFPVFTDKNKKLKKKKMKLYNDTSKSKVGGRVQLFNDKQKIEGEIKALDVCSMYFHAMAIMKVYYPGGKMIIDSDYKDLPEGKIGFYYCDIDQTKLNSISLYPKKTKTGNDWDNFDILENVLISTESINYFKEKGAKVTIKKGYYFTKKYKSCDVFKPLLPLMKIKNEQDILRDNKDPKYNPSLRETVKLFLLIMSGKLVEGMHLDKIEQVSAYNDLETMEKKYGDVKFISMTNNSFYVSYKKDQLKNMGRSVPIYLGSLIYEYSKIHMNKSIFMKISKKGLIYTDTDSCFLTNETFDKWYKDVGSVEKVSHWPEIEEIDKRYKTHTLFNEKSKVFGSFSNEYNGKGYDKHYFISKKCYLSLNTNDKNKVVMKAKGIKIDDIIVENDFKKGDSTNKKLNKIYIKGDKVKDNYLEIYKKFYKNEEVKILTKQLTKVINNNKDNFCNIVTVFKIKKLNG
jgi:hypothetical protein